MATKSFKDFVESTTTQVPQFDPQREVAEWKLYLGQLYGDIEHYLQPYLISGQITIKYTPRTLTEEDLGSYEVNAALIYIGDKKYIISPIGTMLIGSKGRVDLIGPRGSRAIGLVKGNGQTVRVTISTEAESADVHEKKEDNEPWQWKILSRTPPFKFQDLNEESFLNLMVELGDGAS
jgi:hypothetical protein